MMEKAPRGSWPAICISLALFSAYLVMHPYRGIIGDALIYVTHAWAPDAVLAQDLLFVNQSQTSLTIFGPVMRGLLNHFPLSQAAFVAALLGTATWFSGLLALTRALACAMKGGAGAPLLMAGAVCFAPLTYAASPSFATGEFLAVPRPFAEGLVFLAIAALVNGRAVLALSAMAGAFLFHPLMALAGALVVFAWLALGDRRWWLVAGAGIAVACLAAVLGAPLAADLFRTFDGEWAAILREHTSYLFLTASPVSFWTDALLRCAAIFAAVRLCHGPAQRIFAAVLMASLLGIVASILFADVWPSLLVVRLQPWRVLFIGAVFAPLAVAAIALQHREKFRSARVLLAVMACAYALRDNPALSMAFSAGAAGLAWKPPLISALSARIEAALWAVAGFGFVLFGAYDLSKLAAIFAQAPEGSFQWFYVWSLRPLALPAMALVVFLIVREASMPGARTASAIAFASALLAVLHADDRLAIDRMIDARRAPVALADALPEDGGSLLWFGLGREAWHLLQRPNWAAPVQASSIVFSRKLALDWRERTGFLVENGLEPPSILTKQTAPAGWRRDLSPRAIAAVCGRADAPSAIIAPLQESEVAPEGSRLIAAPVPSYEIRSGDEVRLIKMTAYAVFICAEAPAP